jgi:hypothetical protein
MTFTSSDQDAPKIPREIFWQRFKAACRPVPVERRVATRKGWHGNQRGKAAGRKTAPRPHAHRARRLKAAMTAVAPSGGQE